MYTAAPFTAFLQGGTYGFTIGATLFAAAQNLTNERYSGSVQVDNAANRYFEPSDARSFFAGMRWSR